MTSAFLLFTGGRSQKENVQRYNLLDASDLRRGRSSAQLSIVRQPVRSLQSGAAGRLYAAVPPLSAAGTDQPGADSCR